MKLNLLPTSVSKAGAATGMWFVAAILAVVGILGCIGLMGMSQQALASAKTDAEAKMKKAVDAKATADQADAQIAAAAVINRSQKLSEAMVAHNSKYVDLYAKVLGHVPTYYRLDSITATPSGPQTTVTLNGYIETFRQYADLSIALWKIPGVVSVNRAGYNNIDPVVQGLNEADQSGSAIRPGETALPSDPLARLDALIARAASAPRGYLNAGNFGSNTVTARGAMPGYSPVTMTVVLSDDVQTPDPRATISAAGGAASGAAAAPNGFGGVTGGPGAGAGGGRAVATDSDN